MKKLIAVGVISLAFVAGCSTAPAPAPAPVVTVTAPALPTVDPQDQFINDLFEEVWGEMSTSDQQEACSAWLAFPDQFWAGFRDGMDEYGSMITRTQFDTFFTSKCSY